MKTKPSEFNRLSGIAVVGPDTHKLPGEKINTLLRWPRNKPSALT
jgi:hypothetical protein